MKHSWFVFAVFVILAAALLVTGYFINPQGTVEATLVANLGAHGSVLFAPSAANLRKDWIGSVKSCIMYLSSGVVVVGEVVFPSIPNRRRSGQLN